MKEVQKINLPIYFLNKPGVFQIRNVEEYRLFLESYCIGKGLDYFYFRVKFDKFLINSNIDNLVYDELKNYPNWTAIIRLRSSSNDQMSLDILKNELDNFIDKNMDDIKIIEIFAWTYIIMITIFISKGKRTGQIIRIMDIPLNFPE